MRTWNDVGIELPYGAATEVRTTCPRCSATRRKSHIACLAINVDKGAWYCWHCGWHGSLHGRLQTQHAPLPIPSPVLPDDRRRVALRWLWRESRCITSNDPVETYMRQRGLPFPLSDVPTVLRYHPRLLYVHDDGRCTFHPAMVALVVAPHGTPVSLHRTYLTHNGHKADVPNPKQLMPPAIPGATCGGGIRLYPPGDTLAVTEGIETALAVRLLTGLPVWAAMCARGLATLVMPATVRLVIICADHDMAGQEAAKALARRLLADGRRVKLLTPDTPGADWADTMERDYAS